jgi:hypothetical protein
MKTIETTIVVDESHQATVQLPADVAPGSHRVLMVIEGPTTARAPLTFAAHDVGPWPEGFRIRREEIYGDDGQ